MSRIIIPFKCGKASKMVVAIPSFAPDANHCSLGTRMKSAMLGSEENIICFHMSTDYIGALSTV